MPINFAYHAAPTPQAQELLTALKSRYGQTPIEDADYVIAIGGDGSMLHCLHQAYALKKPVFGINRGSVGFLMNHTLDAMDDAYIKDLPKHIQGAHALQIHPLVVEMSTPHGNKTLHAFNEVSFLRQEHQAAKLGIAIDGKVRMADLVGDGCLVATPVGSSAYNYSAGGPILPVTSNLLALTPLSPFRPRRWSGALLPNDCVIEISVQDPTGRPVSASADYQEVRNISHGRIHLDQDNHVSVLYDARETLEERSIAEQFMVGA